MTLSNGSLSSNNSLSSPFPNFAQARVLVIGDIMVDQYWLGETTRISPESPVPVVKVNQQESRPGGAGNVALNIASLEAEIHLLGIVGQDETAKSLQQYLTKAGVKYDFHSIQGLTTTTKLRVMSRQQQLLRLDFEDNVTVTHQSGEFDQKVAKYMQAADILVLSDYNKGSLINVQNFIKQAKQHNMMVLVDPKGKDFSRYYGADLITPNRAEFEAVVGNCATEDELVEKGLALMANLTIGSLLITRSSQGMTLLRSDSSKLHYPAQAREVFDVTGAGDTVIAVLAAALAAGSNLTDAITMANVAAGIVVAKLGTAVVNTNELRQAMWQDQDLSQKILSQQQLVSAIASARHNNEIIVMTNGCFDILHAGHVKYLQQAKGLGDRLIVAVNDDTSVQRLKGENRPVNPLDRRMQVLSGLASVDWIVCFNEDTPIPLIEKIKPDILVKGGDYTTEEVVGNTVVKRYNGQVRVLDLVDNCSTSLLIKQLSTEQ